MPKYEPVKGYDVFLTGPAGGVPSFDKMMVVLHTSGGSHEYGYSTQTAGAFERVQLLIDLLRNEAKVSYDVATNTFAVQGEEVGEKDV